MLQDFNLDSIERNRIIRNNLAKCDSYALLEEIIEFECRITNFTRQTRNITLDTNVFDYNDYILNLFNILNEHSEFLINLSKDKGNYS